MSPLQLLILAVVAMAGLVTFRLARAHVGRTPFPEGRGSRLLAAGFLAVPPFVFGMLIGPVATAPVLRGVLTVPSYLVILAALEILFWITAMVVRRVTHGRARALLVIALVGSVGDREEEVDTPVTAQLAESLRLVDQANAVFPRGPEFPSQVERAGFHAAWDDLDAVTAALEGRIADDRRLGLGVASAATATARDARSRLATLRVIAIEHGQAWAS